MNEKLKTISNLVRLIESELKDCTDSTELTDKAYQLLREAQIQAIDLQRKIDLVRSWNLEKK